KSNYSVLRSAVYEVNSIAAHSRSDNSIKACGCAAALNISQNCCPCIDSGVILNVLCYLIRMTYALSNYYLKMSFTCILLRKHLSADFIEIIGSLDDDYIGSACSSADIYGNVSCSSSHNLN